MQSFLCSAEKTTEKEEGSCYEQIILADESQERYLNMTMAMWTELKKHFQKLAGDLIGIPMTPILRLPLLPRISSTAHNNFFTLGVFRGSRVKFNRRLISFFGLRIRLMVPVIFERHRRSVFLSIPLPFIRRIQRGRLSMGRIGW